MNLLDRAIEAISPERGVARLRARRTLAAVSGYDAAKRERAAMRNFNPRGQTADGDTLPNLPDMRARSRALMMNAPLAGGAVHTNVTNVVGTGLRLSARADRATLRDLARVDDARIATFEAQAEREWKLFCRAENCESTGELDFDEVQELAFRSTLVDGDCFLPVVGAEQGRSFDFTLQLVEADRVSNPNRRPDSDTLAGGIERGAGNRPIACHVAEIDRVTGVSRNWQRLPMRADDGSPRVLHLLHRRRIGQSRGVPYLAPVMSLLKDLDRYTEAEITAAVLNACFAIMGESPSGDSPLKAEAQAAAGGTAKPGGLKRADIQFEPGMVLEGFTAGEILKSFTPERPSAGFDPFVMAILRQVGVELELPFELLVKHFTASYSAARAALLQAWGYFRMRRAWLARKLCQPAYELALMNAVIRGRVEAPGFLVDPAIRAAWCGSRWTGPSAGQLDPLKEVNAAEKRLQLKISTRTRETSELTGDDWEAVAAELRTEQDLLDELDLDGGLEPTAPAPVQPKPGPQPDPADAADAVDPADGADLEEADAA